MTTYIHRPPRGAKNEQTSMALRTSTIIPVLATLGASALGIYQYCKYSETRAVNLKRKKTLAALNTVAELIQKVVTRIYDLEADAAEAEFIQETQHVENNKSACKCLNTLLF